MKPRILFVGLVLALTSVAAHAQGTYTAASSAESDVNAVINGPTHTAVNGDIIQIPCSGTQSVVWTSQLVVTSNITITALGGTPNSGTSTFGSGTNCLTIRDDVTGVSGPMLLFKPTYAASNDVTTLQNLNIDPFSTSTALYEPIGMVGTATSSGFPQARFDNIIFGNSVQWSESGNSAQAGAMLVAHNVTGVIDHCTVPTGSGIVEVFSAGYGSYLGVGTWGDNSWAQPDSFGGANNWFSENNSFYLIEELSDDEYAVLNLDEIGGARIVNRYNHITCAGCYLITGIHGLDTTGRSRAGRHTETYGNTMTCLAPHSCSSVSSARGGTFLEFGNTVNVQTGASFSNFASMAVYRTVYTATGGWGACGNASGSINGPFDTNDGTTYYSGTTTSGSSGTTMNDTTKSWTTNQLAPNGAPYSVYDTTQNFVAQIASNTATSITVVTSIPEQTNSFAVGDSYQIRRSTVCTDQSGRGAGRLLSGGPSVQVLVSTGNPGPVNEALDPIYEWDNTSNNVQSNIGLTDAGQILANRDYYTDNSHGTPQAQTSPTSPFNGTSGVGFGTLANRPTSCTAQVGYFATDSGSQGTLYQCQSGSWLTYYTPYTYPHPLTTGGTSTTGGNPDPPTNLTATVE